MIKLTDLLKEEETFTATSKKSGETSVFKSKDSRDDAVKAGTHSKIDKDSEEEKPAAEKKSKKEDKEEEKTEETAPKKETKEVKKSDKK